MPDFENKPDFNDALNTLGANQGKASDQTISVNDPDFANKVAAQQQKMAQPQSVSQAQAQAYAETQHLGEPTQPRAASFNANGEMTMITSRSTKKTRNCVIKSWICKANSIS